MQGRWKEGQKVKNVSIIFAKYIQVQEKSCQQPAEETAEQTLLKTCNTSISLSFQPLSVKANLYHRHKPGCRGCVMCHWLRGVCCAGRLSPITRLESCPLPPTHDDQALWHVAKLTGLWSSTYCIVGQVTTKRHLRDSSILPKQGTCFPPRGTNSSAAEQFHQYIKNVH